MEAAGYYIFYGVNWIMTLLPLRVLYIFSDILFLFFYYFPGYRRNIVRTNLLNSFPEKSPEELKRIERKFYRHICDLFIETLKLTHMSNSQLLKRFRMTNPELLEKLYDEGRDVVAILGHYCNWEWLLCLPLFTRLQTVSIYKPLNNKYFDRYMNKIRTRNGMILTPMSSIVREVIDKKKKNIRSLYAFITDQTPPREDIKFWISFLNQDTPVYLGAEKIASKYDMALVFFRIQKIKRGKYSLTVDLLYEHSAGIPDHHLTEAHVRKLEEVIRENPEFWIWSHRRWKHKREQSDG